MKEKLIMQFLILVPLLFLFALKDPLLGLSRARGTTRNDMQINHERLERRKRVLALDYFLALITSIIIHES